jgi:hypothetical protein
MATAPCGRCGAELVERQGLTLIRLFECQQCAGTIEIRVELARRFMLRRICVIGGEARISESAVEKFLEKYRQEEIHASSDLRESEHIEPRARPDLADTRAA